MAKPLVCMLLLAGCDAPGPASPAPELSAGSDSYAVIAGETLRRAAPGVLENDRVSAEATVRLVGEPRYGEVTLDADGGFSYTPNYRYAGIDSFSYEVVNGAKVSEPVQVRLGYPNVVVILVDDLGIGDLAAYNDRAITKTPNLDALAEAGMVFSNAHAAAAVCSTSRYSVLTGNYPQRGRISSGVWNVFESATMIVPGQETLGHIFAEAGYQTAFIGKTHNGAAFPAADGSGYTRYQTEIDFTRPFDRGPTQFGFGYSFLLPGGLSGLQYAYYENDRLVRFDPATQSYLPFTDNTLAQNSFVHVSAGWGEEHNGGRLGAPGWAMDNYDNRLAGQVLTRQALGFLDRAIAGDRAAPGPNPFFLYFAPPQVHTPYSAPEFFDLDKTDDTKPPRSGAPVAGASDFSPRQDAIIELLDARGVLENTLIVFSSDNGPVREPREEQYSPQGLVDGVPLRGFKGEIHEAGHRVPLLVRWGNGSRSRSVIRPGSRSRQLIGLNDLAATFYALLGRQRPEGQANDSKNFLPVLLGQQRTPVRDHLIVQGSPASAADNAPYIDRAYYRRDEAGNLWKLIVNSHQADVLAELEWREFYNLSTDPGEQNDLIADPAHREFLQAMQAEYLDLIAGPRTIESFR